MDDDIYMDKSSYSTRGIESIEKGKYHSYGMAFWVFWSEPNRTLVECSREVPRGTHISVVKHLVMYPLLLEWKCS